MVTRTLLQDFYYYHRERADKKQDKKCPSHFPECKDPSGLNVVEVMRDRYDIFKMSITVDNVKSIIYDLLARVWRHDSNADKADVSDV